MVNERGGAAVLRCPRGVWFGVIIKPFRDIEYVQRCRTALPLMPHISICKMTRAVCSLFKTIWRYVECLCVCAVTHVVSFMPNVCKKGNISGVGLGSGGHAGSVVWRPHHIDMRDIRTCHPDIHKHTNTWQSLTYTHSHTYTLVNIRWLNSPSRNGVRERDRETESERDRVIFTNWKCTWEFDYKWRRSSLFRVLPARKANMRWRWWYGEPPETAEGRVYFVSLAGWLIFEWHSSRRC